MAGSSLIRKGQFSPKVANPIPKPHAGEDYPDFMLRCMLDIKHLGPETATTICEDQFKKVNKARSYFTILKAKPKPRRLKQNLDRLRKRYGYTDEKLHDITGKIIEFNSEKIARRITRITKRDFDKKAKKIGLDPKRLTFPELDDVFPGRTIFIKKGAEQGRLIADTLRGELSRDLRQSISDIGLTARRGRTAGQVKQQLISDFEAKIHKRFEAYTKKDPKLGMPTNIHQIAVTEVRSTVNEVKEKYTKKLIDTNDLAAKKKWIHNRSLSKVPRKGHMRLDGKIIAMDAKFEVKVYKKRFIMRTDLMTRPHDSSAPLDQIVGCNCDIEYIVAKKPERK